MWTSDAHRYVLWRDPDDLGYLPLDISGDEEHAVLIEDDEVAEVVARRMLAAGVPVRESGPESVG